MAPSYVPLFTEAWDDKFITQRRFAVSGSHPPCRLICIACAAMRRLVRPPNLPPSWTTTDSATIHLIVRGRFDFATPIETDELRQSAVGRPLILAIGQSLARLSSCRYPPQERRSRPYAATRTGRIAPLSDSRLFADITARLAYIIHERFVQAARALCIYPQLPVNRIMYQQDVCLLLCFLFTAYCQSSCWSPAPNRTA